MNAREPRSPEDTQKIIDALSATYAFSRRKFNETDRDVWLTALGTRIPSRSVISAIEQHRRQSKEFIKPAHILQILASRPRRQQEPKAPPVPADEKFAAAQMFLIRCRLDSGDPYQGGKVTPEQAEEYLQIANEHAKANDKPDLIPASAWLESVWGYPCPHHGERPDE